MKENIDKLKSVSAHIEDTASVFFKDLLRTVIKNLEQFEKEKSEPKVKTDSEDEPELVGHLNKTFGFNGFKIVGIGTPVYHLKGSFFFEQTPENGGPAARVRYSIETLTPCINFIK